MVARRYQDLECWQLARELERRVFAFTAQTPASHDFDYCRQVRKSSSSGSRNLVEGFARFWPSENARFVRISRASLAETRDHLDAALERGYVATREHNEMISLCDRAIGATTNYVLYLERAVDSWPKSHRRSRKR